MTTTVQNVFADTLSTATSANGPTLETDNNSPSATSTASQSYSSNWPGYDPDGPTNTYDSTKYVYQVQFNYTSINFTLTVNSIDSYDVDGPRTLSSSNLGTDFYYRGSGTQSGATNTLPASVSTTQTFTGGTTATNGEFSRNYSVSRTFNVNASWHWEGNLFSIDGVGGDTFEDIAVQSTLTCSAGVNPGGESIVSADCQLTCDATKVHSAQSTVTSQFTTSITSAVTHDFDISGVTVTYVESYDAYTSSDYVATGYFDDGVYIPDGYVETQSFTGVIQEVASDGQLTAVGGFIQSGDTAIAADVQTTISGVARPSLQGAAIIAADVQTSITGVNVFGAVASTMATDVATSSLAGLLIEIGGANYHNRYVEEGYTTPEADLTDFDSDTQFTASAIRLQGGEGLLESAAAIQLEGGYLISQGSLLLNGDGQFTINQTAGTSAGLILASADLDVTIDTQLTPTANNIIGIETELFNIDSQMSIVGGEIDFGVMSITIDATVNTEGRIIPKTSGLIQSTFSTNIVGGFLKDLAAAIQSDGFALTVAQYKIVDPFRTIRVKSETRTINVPIENRLYTIDTENRVNKVEQEIRSYIVPQEIRQIKVQHLILDRGTPVGSNERRIG